MTHNVILITGIPGAGKTTIAEIVAKRLERSVMISCDVLRKMVIGGYKSASQPWDEETRKQYYLSFKNSAALCQNFIDAGFNIIIDDTLHAGDLYLEWSKYFGKFLPIKILLMPKKEIALQRNRERGSHFVNEHVIEDVYDHFVKNNYEGWIVLDNSKKTAEETADEILAL